MKPTHFKPRRDEFKHSQITDEELVAQFVRTGQNELLGQLYSRCYDRIYNQCFNVFKDQELAQDSTHDIFLKIIPKLSTFRHSSRFSYWLSRVTYNHCMDQFHKSGSMVKLPIENYPELAAEDPWIHYFQDEPGRLGRLMHAISVLPPEEQLTLKMRYADNLSLKDISEQFDINISATKMRLLRSRKRLRDAVMKVS